MIMNSEKIMFLIFKWENFSCLTCAFSSPFSYQAFQRPFIFFSNSWLLIHFKYWFINANFSTCYRICYFVKFYFKLFLQLNLNFTSKYLWNKNFLKSTTTIVYEFFFLKFSYSSVLVPVFFLFFLSLLKIISSIKSFL